MASSYDQRHIIRSPHEPLSQADGPRRGDNLAAFLERNPNKVPDDNAAYIRLDGKILTRKDLFKASRATAWSIQNVLKLDVGARIAIFSPNSTWYPVVVHANLSAGVTNVTLSPAYSAEELSHPLADCRPDYIFAAPALVDVARDAMKRAKLPPTHAKSGRKTLWIMTDTDEMAKGSEGEADVRKLIDEAKGKELAPIPLDDPAKVDSFICYSSGTSGKPKGVELTHSNHIWMALQMPRGRFGDYKHDDVTLAVLPFQHIFALFHLVLADLWFGVTVVVMARFELEPFLNAIQRYRIARLEIVPPICVALAKSPLVDQYDLTSLKILLCGAAPLSADLGDQVEARLNKKRKDGKQGNVRLCQGYGLSETAPSVSAGKAADYHLIKGSIGSLFPNIEARLVDEDGKDVGHEQGREGKPGELWVRGPTIMRGYLNRPDATREAIDEDGWFKTGDVAIAPESDVSHARFKGKGHGEHFWIVDRKKELIKYKGFQVAPAELEALLLEHPSVGDSAVIGIYVESEATELPLAFIVPSASWKGGDEAALADEVRKWVDGKVAGHKRLRGGVRVRESIPVSPSGKILRRMLRDEIAQEAAAAAKGKKDSKL